MLVLYKCLQLFYLIFFFVSSQQENNQSRCSKCCAFYLRYLRAYGITFAWNFVTMLILIILSVCCDVEFNFGKYFYVWAPSCDRLLITLRITEFIFTDNLVSLFSVSNGQHQTALTYLGISKVARSLLKRLSCFGPKVDSANSSKVASPVKETPAKG